MTSLSALALANFEKLIKSWIAVSSVALVKANRVKNTRAEEGPWIFAISVV
jgi:hypothetical protein